MMFRVQGLELIVLLAIVALVLRNLQPMTLNPKSTLDPKPEIQNPKS